MKAKNKINRFLLLINYKGMISIEIFKEWFNKENIHLQTNKGKLIVIEGSDGSGKATQTKKLYDKLFNDGCNIKKIEYPNYSSRSSSLIKMYLNGEFGDKPNDVNPYISSTFYAVDRFASYKKDWKNFYEDGGIILADRYITSNMIHQGVKIDNKIERNAFLDWLWDFEFNMFELPIPNCVISLDMLPEYSRNLIKERKNKNCSNTVKDIHENNYNYLINSYNNACSIAKKYKWHRINCVTEKGIKDIDEIHREIYSIIKKIL